MGEEICSDFVKANTGFNIILLRYFNPVGAHSSALIGERNKQPENLVPIITQTAIGIRPAMTVFGNDYPTRDGSCIRDYIHVMDIANAHTKAMQQSISNTLPSALEIYNLGTGTGVTVLELIASFEKVSGVPLNYTIGERRAGDVIAVYANNEKAQMQLGWMPQYNIESMMKTAWQWQLQLSKNGKQAYNN
jgi:UDP-glucose 4-epimerase